MFFVLAGCEDSTTRAPASMCGVVAGGAAREGFAQIDRIALITIAGKDPDEEDVAVEAAPVGTAKMLRPFRVLAGAGAAFLRGRPAARLVGAEGSVEGCWGFGPPGRAALNWL